MKEYKSKISTESTSANKKRS